LQSPSHYFDIQYQQTILFPLALCIFETHTMNSDVFLSVPDVLKKLPCTKYLSVLLVSCFSSVTLAAEEPVKALNLTEHGVGYAALVIFSIAYLLAMIEEVTELKKSKPMVFAASIIWILIAAVYINNGMSEQAGRVFRSSLEAYAELFLFIMVSMTYLNAMEDRGVFENLRVWLLSKNFSYRKLFWITGFQVVFHFLSV